MPWSLLPSPQAINKPVQILEATQARVDLDQLLGIGAFSLDRVLAVEPDFLVGAMKAIILQWWDFVCLWGWCGNVD